MASFSTCYLEFVALNVNLVKYKQCYDYQMVIYHFGEVWLTLRVWPTIPSVLSRFHPSTDIPLGTVYWLSSKKHGYRGESKSKMYSKDK